MFQIKYLATLVAVMSLSLINTGQAQELCVECEENPHNLSMGAELTYFRLNGNQGAGGNSGAGNVDDYFPDYGYQPSGRYWIELQNDSGIGVRGRYFDWSDSQEYLGLTRESSFEMWDIEATFDSHFENFDVTWIGGLRHGSVELDGSDFGEPNPYNFEGNGLTLGADLRRPLGLGFSVIGGGRFSVLYGDTTFEPVSGASLDNTTLDIWEGRLGLEWAHEMQDCGRIAVSAAWEHQLYGTDTYFPFAIDPETVGNVSLAGTVFSVSYEY